jgi:hypothetical protein
LRIHSWRGAWVDRMSILIRLPHHIDRSSRRPSVRTAPVRGAPGAHRPRARIVRATACLRVIKDWR